MYLVLYGRYRTTCSRHDRSTYGGGAGERRNGQQTESESTVEIEAWRERQVIRYSSICAALRDSPTENRPCGLLSATALTTGFYPCVPRRGSYRAERDIFPSLLVEPCCRDEREPPSQEDCFWSIRHTTVRKPRVPAMEELWENYSIVEYLSSHRGVSVITSHRRSRCVYE